MERKLITKQLMHSWEDILCETKTDRQLLPRQFIRGIVILKHPQDPPMALQMVGQQDELWLFEQVVNGWEVVSDAVPLNYSQDADILRHRMTVQEEQKEEEEQKQSFGSVHLWRILN